MVTLPDRKDEKGNMFPCPNCQTQLPERARFCNKCGFHQTNVEKQTTIFQSAQCSDSPGEESLKPANQSHSTHPCPLPTGEFSELSGNSLYSHLYPPEATLSSRGDQKKSVFPASTSFLDGQSTFLPYLPSKLPGTSSRNLRTFSTFMANGEERQDSLNGAGQPQEQRVQPSLVGSENEAQLHQSTNTNTSMSQLMLDTSLIYSSRTGHLQGVIATGRHNKNPLLTVWGLTITIIFTLTFVTMVGVITYLTLLKP